MQKSDVFVQTQINVPTFNIMLDLRMTFKRVSYRVTLTHIVTYIFLEPSVGLRLYSPYCVCAYIYTHSRRMHLWSTKGDEGLNSLQLNDG
jgi:hypothetical protein